MGGAARAQDQADMASPATTNTAISTTSTMVGLHGEATAAGNHLIRGWHLRFQARGVHTPRRPRRPTRSK
jgi:hypothetical protein